MDLSEGLLSSHQILEATLHDVLTDFAIPLPTLSDGPDITYIGAIPPSQETRSEKINLSLIGTIPSLANAVAAAQIFCARKGNRQNIEVDLRRGHNYIDPDIGMTPTLNGQEITVDVVVGNPFLRNIFETRDGRYVVLSAVYVDLVYKWTAFLGCSMAESDVREKVKQWSAKDLEGAAEEAGLPMAICQTESSWQAHPHGSHLAKLPWVPVEHYPTTLSGPSPSPYSFLPAHPSRPLSGLRVLCVTHAIAGPSTGRTLAEHGASVLQIMFTHGFEHAFVYTYANLGTASSRLNLHKLADRQRLQTLVKDAHVWVDSYRPNAISKFGFSDNEIRNLNPSIIICRVRVYGTTGPWRSKPGFDMQGSASSGLMCFMGEGQGDGRPRWPPGMVINDYTTGYSAALAIQSIILKRTRGEVDVRDGWLVSPSLCGTAMGILKYYKTSRFKSPADQEGVQALAPSTLEAHTTLGYLKTLAPLPKMSITPMHYAFGVLSTMGSNPPIFPGYDDGYDVRKALPMLKEEILHELGDTAVQTLERLKALGERLREKRVITTEVTARNHDITLTRLPGILQRG
ncbi:hypothetical protein LTR84_011504 [Exophiala bonariae]|uniref:CoA-transferase family III n=1 Tax=Exophiala bonariae TaxID=1690606 RepID=A0AAV9NJU8_9EURO|nr:hypothetical protein LTR84_011504 [Exophiala bonariae]